MNKKCKKETFLNKKYPNNSENLLIFIKTGMDSICILKRVLNHIKTHKISYQINLLQNENEIGKNFQGVYRRWDNISLLLIGFKRKLNLDKILGPILDFLSNVYILGGSKKAHSANRWSKKIFFLPKNFFWRFFFFRFTKQRRKQIDFQEKFSKILSSRGDEF